MQRILPVFALFVFLLLIPATAAPEKNLPRVLYLGDAVHQQIVQEAAGELRGKVEFVFPRILAENTHSALEKLDEILGDEKWDLIYFNYGLGDLIYKDPSTREIRAMSKFAGGIRVSKPAKYQENLEAIVKRLKKTEAKLMWGTTTPMIKVNAFPGYRGNLFDANSEQEYNAIAARIMEQHRIPVCDVHSYILSKFGPDDSHPEHSAYQNHFSRKLKIPIATPVIDGISHALDGGAR
ncbi:MAG: SGNH/GDSL hydrolase family protein [Verrucomicrobiales bacterium]|nr:SGNH/GDSL hydrolase family protein [Verrucomicrobiales bacterium]